MFSVSADTGKRPIISAVEHYINCYEKRSPEELRDIAHVKRYLELISMDPDFRRSLKEDSGDGSGTFNAWGIDLDPADLGIVRGNNGEGPLKAESGPDFPLQVLWGRWIRDLREFRTKVREDGYSDVADPRFNAWRRRQVERVTGELGYERADSIVHTILCFELSKGCSVGCWFCAFEAQSLQGVFQRVPDNTRLWRDMLHVAVDLFGTAAQTGFCYGATEPHDNPHYLDFIEDVREIVGVLPQTTSAVPAKDLRWTRRLIEMQRKPPSKPSRFSILRLSDLRKLHETFTPEELLRFELLPQNRDSISSKTRAGKTLEKADDPTNRRRGLRVTKNAGTIACVSGFQVNMVDRSIELVSPCSASAERPLGYRVFTRDTFETAQDFGDFIEQAIANHMPLFPPDDRPIAFRGDLKAGPLEDGFVLHSPHRTHSCNGGPHIRYLGWLISQGKHTIPRIVNMLVELGTDIFTVRATIQDLFDKGLLEE